MSYFGSGGQNGASGRPGGNPTALLTGPPQLFVNSNQQLQFQTGTQNFTFPQADGQQSQLQLNTGGAPLLLQPPVNFVTDQLGLGQLITQAAVTQSQQNLQNIMNLGSVLQMTDQQSQSGSQQSKQRVFTGMVTKIHDNFGFIDEEVFFQMGVVKGPILPKEGDRVLVEADFNPSMPFKWNSTRVQIVNMGGSLGGQGSSSQNQQQSQHTQQQQQQQQQQYQQQMLGYPTSMSSVQKPIQAPPPPSISGGRSQTVSIVSNPHSIYSSSIASRAAVGGVHVPESMSVVRRPPQLQPHMDPSAMLTGGSLSLPSLLQKLDRADRERRDNSPQRRDRKNRSKDRDRGRERSKERLRERDRERDRRDRDRSPRERRRSRSRSKSPRERRVISRRSPSPIKRRSRERERVRDRTPESRGDRDRIPERIPRDRSSPVSFPVVNVSTRAPKAKRSRSRETVKSEGKNISNDTNCRSISPPASRRNKSVINKAPPRYSIEVPQFALDKLEINGKNLKQRYSNLYIPSDFFLARASWMEAFPLHKPFTFGKPTNAHIFGRRVEKIEVPDVEGLCERFKQIPNVLDAPDSSNTFKVKVMILAVGNLESIYKKVGILSDSKTKDKDADLKDEEGFSTFPRMLNFVVGVKNGKHDILALGGAWSPSLDGINPQSDPHVLINTAIRSVKALAGIDLTRCKQWFRFMDLYYRRSNGNLETVVYFLPDTSSCVPGKSEWDSTISAYRIALHGKDTSIITDKKPKSTTKDTTQETQKPLLVTVVEEEVTIENPVPILIDEQKESELPPPPLTTAAEDSTRTTGANEVGGEEGKLNESVVDPDIVTMEVVDECNGDDALEEEVALLLHEIADDTTTLEEIEPTKVDSSFDIYDDIVEVSGEDILATKTTMNNKSPSESTEEKQKVAEIVEEPIAEEKTDESEDKEDTPKGTHYSQLVLKNMNVAKLREELSLRNLSTKGLKSQLTTRLMIAIKDEEEADQADTTIAQKDDGLPVMDISTDGLESQETPASTTETEEISVLKPEYTEEEVGSLIRLVDPSKIMESADESEEVCAPLLDISISDETKMEDGEIKDEEPDEVAKGSDTLSKYPIIKPDMSLEEKKLWERRYALPKNPKVLVFPIKTIKYFDCSLMPLSSLRDYRIVDSKEESFEVSLFSEFFYEMIQRDFAFRIYREVEKHSRNSKPTTEKTAELTKEQKEEPAKEKESKETVEPTSKRRKTSNASSVTVDSSKEKESKEKLVVVDPFLLLAFTFYDKSRTGYMIDTDVEEIFASLGLGLTRRELQKVLKKVALNGYLRYRKWTHKSETDASTNQELADDDIESIKKIAQGNKSLLPVFTYSTPVVTLDDGLLPNGLDKNENVESVLATVDGQLVDVRKIKNQVETAEKDRVAAEANANVLKNSLNEAKNQVSEMKKSNESLKDELSRTKETLKRLETSDKSNKEDLEVFRKATERFMERVKDVAKLPTCSKDKEKKGKEETKSAPKSTINIA